MENICKHLGVCGSCKLHTLNYEEQLFFKIDQYQPLFDSFFNKKIDIFRSKPIKFRARAEFRIWHNGNEINYAMTKLNKNGTLEIDECLIVNETISNLMPKIILAIKEKQIDKKIFACEFLTTSIGEVVISLIYHKHLDEIWQTQAKLMSDDLNINIIGRSKKQKIIIGTDTLKERLRVNDQTFTFLHTENSFTQPNSFVNEKMIGWVLDNVENVGKNDLLELYCGAGNFTIPLSKKYNKVIATEISKTAIRTAIENTKLNNINNITFLRMSSEDFTSAINKEREFVRLKDIDLDSYNLKSIFVDPPRSGLDDKTRLLVANYNHIIYISCNPKTLQRDLEHLSQTHNVLKMAMFDQFPYTEHLEMGAILKMKEK